MKNIIIAFLITLFITIRGEDEYPQLQIFQNVLTSQGYIVKNFISIRYTNIIIVNTILNESIDSNIVYYYDISSTYGEVVNIIKPEYIILEMYYSQDLEQIIILSTERIIYADPFTLSITKSIANLNNLSMNMNPDSNFAIITTKSNSISILDLKSASFLASKNYGGDETNRIYETQSFINQGLEGYTFQIYASTPKGVLYFVYYSNQSFTQFSIYNSNIIDNYYIKVAIYNDMLFFANKGKILASQIFDIDYMNLMDFEFDVSLGDLWVTNIMVKQMVVDGNQQLILLVGNSESIYKIRISIDYDNYLVKSDSIQKFSQSNYYSWYALHNLNRIVISSQSYFSIYDFADDSFRKCLYFQTDGYSNRLSILDANNKQILISFNQQNMYINQRGQEGENSDINLKFSQPLYNKPSNIIEIKYNPTTIYLAKLRDNQNDYLSTFSLLSLNQPTQSIPLTGSLSFKWDSIQSIDPFYYKESQWVIITQNNKIHIININDPNQSYQPQQNGQSDIFSFALVSLEDPSNQILIGIDQQGCPSVWDFSESNFPDLPFLYSNFVGSNDKAVKGIIFEYKTIKKVIMASFYNYFDLQCYKCENEVIIQIADLYELNDNDHTVLRVLTSIPEVMKYFSSINCLAISDQNLGIAYIYLYNPDSDRFDLLITIQPLVLNDTPLSIELIQETTLWIQYTNSQLFYDLKLCLQDHSQCLFKESAYYFNPDNQSQNSSFGLGTIDNPYRNSRNIIIPIANTLKYQQVISGFKYSKVSLLISEQNPFYLAKQMVSFSFVNRIILVLSSYPKAIQQAVIKYDNQLSFEGFKGIMLQNLTIKYCNSASCGLQFLNIIDKAYIDDIQQISDSNSISCQKILVNSSFLQITKYQISDTKFNKNSYFIYTNNVNQLLIDFLSFENCLFAENFYIINQATNLNLQINMISLSKNYCDESYSINTYPIPLIAAGNFNIQGAVINKNTFCNNFIFGTIASFAQESQTFKFQGIQMTDNTFYTQTSYVFFNAQYQFLIKEKHEFILSDSIFSYNKLKYQYTEELQVSSLIQLNKIATVKIVQVTLENHANIQLLLIENSKNIIIDGFNCINNDDFLNQIDDSIIYTGCIEINEAKIVTINTLIFDKKIVKDNSIFIIKNYQTKEAILNISDGQFKNLGLSQTIINSNSNPFYIFSNYQIAVNLFDCHFDNNSLNTHQLAQSATSTTGLWVNNLLGEVTIKESTFNNCYSNSKYNFMYINSNSLSIQSTNFSKSSFLYSDESDQQTEINLFIQQGGMMNVKVNQLIISDSEFTQSSAQQGSFLQIESQGSQLTISISQTQFSEGYSLHQGGAFYIDSLGQIIDFTCQQCNFTNIYTGYSYGSSISIVKYENGNEVKNSYKFIGGNFINIYGYGDSNFIILTYSSLIIENILKITSQEFVSNSKAHIYFQSYLMVQQATLLYLLNNSEATILSSHFLNLKIEENTASYPLIANLVNSQLTLTKSSIKNSIFTTSIINAYGGKVIFLDTEVNDVNQSNNKERILELLVEETPQSNGNSLIIVDSGSLEASQNSSFKSISCKSNCNGGVIQVKNGSVNLQKIVFDNINSTFGGVLFLYGITGTNNLIQEVDFLNCFSQYDGGALYIKSMSSDSFNLKIQNSNFESNMAQQGGGGAIYIRSDSQNNKNQIIKINKSNFINNKAQVGGGIDSQNISPIISIDSIFQNNKGLLFGQDKISYPSKLVLKTQSQILNQYKGKLVSNYLELDDFKSGDLIENLSFQLRNEYDEIIIPTTINQLSTYSVQVRIHPSTNNYKNYEIRDVLTVNFNTTTNLFTFDNLTFVGKLESSAVFQFRSDQIYTLNKNNEYEQNYSFEIKINFRNCSNGEQIQEYNSLTECETCKSGKYSYNVQQCQDCPQGATCNGGTDVVANQGYWRKTNESEVFIHCDNQISNCIGGRFGDNICFEGHIGALCEECDIYGDVWGAPYSRSSKYSCQRCDQIKNNIWIVILMTAWTMISMTLAIRSNIEYVKEKAAALTLHKHLRNRRQNSQKMVKSISEKQFDVQKSEIQGYSNFKKKQQQDNSSIYIKMLTNYMQIVGCISSFNLSIPDSILEVPQSVGTPLKQQTNSLDCALQQIDTNMPVIYIKLLFQMMIPFIYLILFIIIIAIQQASKKGEKFPWYKISTGAMFQIIYVQPDLVSQVIALLSCRQIGDTNYILSNVSYECYTSQHINYIAGLVLPLFLLWVFVLPITLYQLLKRNKDQLDSMQIQLKYGFLYKEYTNEGFYWEFIKMVQKLAIILVLNFYSQDIITKGVLIIIVISIYGLLSSFIKPYKEGDINSIDQSSTYTCVITVQLAIFIYSNPYNYLVYIAIIAMIIINLKFILSLLIKIVQQYLPKAKEAFILIATQLSKKFPYFKKFIQEKQIRQMNPIVKDRMRKIFNKFINMKPAEKNKFLLKILEQQFEEKYKHLKTTVDESVVLNKEINKTSSLSKQSHSRQSSQINKEVKNNQTNEINSEELVLFKDDDADDDEEQVQQSQQKEEESQEVPNEIDIKNSNKNNSPYILNQQQISIHF